MFEKKLYTLCAVLSLSCSVYALEGRAGEDNFASSPSMSRFGPSSSATSEQETDKIGVSDDPSPKTLIFKWSHLLKARGKDSKKGHRARTLLAYLHYLREVFYDQKRDREVWQRRDPESVYTLLLSIKDLEAPNGHFLNPLWVKYGKDTDKAIKIATIIGVLPTTKEVITEVGSVLLSPRKLPHASKGLSRHKQRELQLKRLSLEAAHRLKEEKAKRQRLQASLEDEIKEKEAIKKEKEELSAELENLKDECQRLQSDFEGVADFFVFNFQR